MSFSTCITDNSTSVKFSQIFCLASKLFSKKSFGLALGHFLVLAQSQPDWKKEIYENVLICVASVSPALERNGRHDELLKLYESVLGVFHQSAEVNFALGQYLYRHGHNMAAAGCLGLALRVSVCTDDDVIGAAAADGDWWRPLPAQERTQCRWLLDCVCCRLVDRWHFSMLNDRARNSAYRRAIGHTVRSQLNSLSCSSTPATSPASPATSLASPATSPYLVLDIGCGTGLLSMMAVSAGASCVYACDESQTMCRIAHTVLADNRMTDRVSVINKNSTQLIVGRDIPHRASLLVTEVFDCGLFGERVLQTLEHAWRHLLCQSDRSRVVPAGAALYVAAVECPYLRTQFAACCHNHSNNNNNNNSCCSDRSNGDDSCCGSCGSCSCLRLRLDEPYWSEQLAHVPGGYRLLTQPCQVTDVDFNSYQDICRVLNDPGRCHVLRCCESGRADALVTWFTLRLTDTVTVSNSPLTCESDDSHGCWEQAVFPLATTTTTGGGGSRQVTPADSLTVSVSCRQGCLTVSLVNADTPPSTASSSTTTADVIHFVNDSLFADWLSHQLANWLTNQNSPARQSTNHSSTNCDWTNHKESDTESTNHNECDVESTNHKCSSHESTNDNSSSNQCTNQQLSSPCHVTSILPHSIVTVEHLVKTRFGDKCCFTHLAAPAVTDPTGNTQCQYSDLLQSRLNEDGSHALLWYPFLSCGLLDSALVQMVNSLTLSPGTALFPCRFALMAVLVQSRDIANMAAVHTDNTLSYNCDALNVFQVHTQQDVLIGNRCHVQVSDIVQLAEMSLIQPEHTTVVTHHFSITPAPSNRRPDALLFWFLPSPIDVATVNVDVCHRKCGAVLCKSSNGVVTGTVSYTQSNVHVTLH